MLSSPQGIYDCFVCRRPPTGPRAKLEVVPLATLIANPAAGRFPRLAAQLPAIEALLAAHGYTARLRQTTAAPDSAARLAREAIADSALVLACGGDGTVHGVVQGLAHIDIPLGILPLGTHNALASSLGLPPDPLAALARLLPTNPCLIPLGKLVTETDTRFFTTMAGCGPSGALAHALAAGSRGKRRLGRATYPLHAARFLATQRWPAFRVEYRAPGSTTWHSLDAASLLVSRVPSLGGLFARLTPGASLLSPSLHAYVLPSPLHVTFPTWFATSFTGMPNPWLRQLQAEEIRCTPIAAAPVLLQADAEPLGALPASLRVVPGALNLLLPKPVSI